MREGACIGAATMLQPWTWRLIINAAAFSILYTAVDTHPKPRAREKKFMTIREKLTMKERDYLLVLCLVPSKYRHRLSNVTC